MNDDSKYFESKTILRGGYFDNETILLSTNNRFDAIHNNGCLQGELLGGGHFGGPGAESAQPKPPKNPHNALPEGHFGLEHRRLTSVLT